MEQSNREIYHYQNNEIDLLKLINFLVLRKLLIFVLTGFVTLLAIIYSLNLTPTYKTVSTFTSPSALSIIKINKLNLSSDSMESRESVFTEFLTNLTSKELQAKVFIDGGYLSEFNPKNNPIDDIDSFIEESLKSVEINPPSVTSNELSLGFLIELPYSISMIGVDASLISRYLNELVATSEKITIEKIMGIIAEKIAIRLDEILIERELLIEKTKQYRLSQIERINEEDAQKIREINDQIDRARFTKKENRLNEIVVLTDAAKVAKALGIIENNFKLIGDDSFNSKLTIAIGENEGLPSWYLYGEKALLERIELLKNRKSDDPFIPELVTLKSQLLEVQNNNVLKTLKSRQDDSPFIDEIVKLDIEKTKLESLIIDNTGINAMQISQTATNPKTPIKQNKRMIVLTAFIGSLMMSILLALVMNVIKTNEKSSA